MRVDTSRAVQEIRDTPYGMHYGGCFGKVGVGKRNEDIVQLARREDRESKEIHVSAGLMAVQIIGGSLCLDSGTSFELVLNRDSRFPLMRQVARVNEPATKPIRGTRSAIIKQSLEK